MYYGEVINSLVEDLKRDIRVMEAELTGSPEGFLTREVKSCGTYYSQQLPPRGFRKKVKRVGITKDKDMIHRLARKRYLKESLSLARRNLQILQEASAQILTVHPIMV